MQEIKDNSTQKKLIYTALGAGTLGLAGFYLYKKSIEAKTFQYQIQKVSNDMIKSKNKNIQKQLQTLNKIIKDNLIKKISTIPQFQEMKNSICSRQLQVNENYYVCLECSKTFDDNQMKNLSEDDKKDKKNINFYNHMAMCEPCYQQCGEKHQGHYVEQRKVKAYAHNMVCCDCGDQNFLEKSGFCDDHCGFDEEQILKKISEINESDKQLFMEFLMHLFYVILQHCEATKFDDNHQSTAISIIKNILNLLQDLQTESVVFRYLLGQFLIKKWKDFDPVYLKSSWKFSHKCTNLDCDNLQDDLNIQTKQHISKCECNFFEVVIQYVYLQSLEIHEVFYKMCKDITTINQKFNNEITYSLSKKVNQCLFAKKLFLQHENKTVIFMDLAEIYDILAFLIDDKQREKKVIEIGKDFLNHIKTFNYLLKLYFSKGLYQLTYKSLFEIMQVFYYSLRNPNISKSLVQHEGLFKEIFESMACYDRFLLQDKLQTQEQFLMFIEQLMPAMVITKEMHFQVNSHIQSFLLNLAQLENKNEIFQEMSIQWRKQIEQVQLINENNDPKSLNFTFTMTLPLMVTYLPLVLSKEIPNKKKITEIFEKYLLNFKYSENKINFAKSIKRYILLFRQQLKNVNAGYIIRSLIKAQQEQGINSELYNGYMKLEYKTTNSLIDEENFGYQMLCLYEKDTNFIKEKYFDSIIQAHQKFENLEKLSEQEDEVIAILLSAIQEFIGFLVNDSYLFNCFGNEQQLKIPNVDKDYLYLQEQFIRKVIINILQLGKHQYNDLVEKANWSLNKSFQINHLIEEISQVDPVTKLYSLKKDYEFQFYPYICKFQIQSIKKTVKDLEEKYLESLSPEKKNDFDYLLNDSNYPLNQRHLDQLPELQFFRELWKGIFSQEYVFDTIINKIFLNIYDKCINIDTKRIILQTVFKIVQLVSIALNDPLVEQTQEDTDIFNKFVVNNEKLIEKLNTVVHEFKEEKIAGAYINAKRTLSIINEFQLLTKQRKNSQQID